MQKISGIYKITSPSGRVYIGQSWNIKHRWYTYRCPGFRKTQPKLYASFHKYGARNHDYTILMVLPHGTLQSVMDECEQFFIALFRDRDVSLLNLAYGGRGGRHSEETRQKIGLKSKGHPPNKTSYKKGHGSGLSRPTYIVDKIRASNTGKRHSEATKTIIRAKRARQVITHSEETREKISRANQGKKRSLELMARMAEINKGNKYRLREAAFGRDKKKDIGSEERYALTVQGQETRL